MWKNFLGLLKYVFWFTVVIGLSLILKMYELKRL